MLARKLLKMAKIVKNGGLRTREVNNIRENKSRETDVRGDLSIDFPLNGIFLGPAGCHKWLENAKK